jgi:hypothetical protein
VLGDDAALAANWWSINPSIKAIPVSSEHYDGRLVCWLLTKVESSNPSWGDIGREEYDKFGEYRIFRDRTLEKLLMCLPFCFAFSNGV